MGHVSGGKGGRGWCGWQTIVLGIFLAKLISGDDVVEAVPWLFGVAFFVCVATAASINGRIFKAEVFA